MIFDKNSDLMTVTLPYGLSLRDCHNLINFLMSTIFFSILRVVISPSLSTYVVVYTKNDELISPFHSVFPLPIQAPVP